MSTSAIWKSPFLNHTVVRICNLAAFYFHLCCCRVRLKIRQRSQKTEKREGQRGRGAEGVRKEKGRKKRRELTSLLILQTTCFIQRREFGRNNGWLHCLNIFTIMKSGVKIVCGFVFVGVKNKTFVNLREITKESRARYPHRPMSYRKKLSNWCIYYNYKRKLK